MIDTAQLAAAIRDVDTRMKGHAGGIELISAGADGVVEVRFTGMCQGCFARPTTFEGTIRPRLMQVAGVTELRANGTRLSDEATARFRALLGTTPPDAEPAERSLAPSAD